jgi:D-hexose-6-phosphate mutarotase
MAQSLEELQRLAIDGIAAIDAGRGGLPRIAIAAHGAAAEIYLHGAHVTQYTTPGGKPLLFLSKASRFAAGQAIRGGVPLIFPWFGPNAADASLPAHGFARTQTWRLRSITPEPDRVVVDLALAPSDVTRRLWPHEFELSFRVSVGRALEMALRVHNPGTAAFKFEEAMHSYFAIADVRQLTIHGLAGREYLDKVQKGARLRQGVEPITITGETDRVYLDTPDPVTVNEPDGRTITVAKSGSLATVVWNPWIAKAKAMADFGDDEWPEMLCIETANAAGNAVTLAPGAEHVMTATVSAT